VRLTVALVLLSLAVCCTASAQGERRPVPEFEVKLDEAPATRFSAVTSHFNATIQNFFNKYLAKHTHLIKAVEDLSKKRGPEPEEMQEEIRGVAQVTGLPELGIQAMNMLYELQTLMVPIENITIPWSGPGCTGIIAMDKEDGTVYHARNLDFSPKEFMQDLAYIAVFTRGGKEVFRAQMIAAYSCPLTSFKMGPDGFAVETNTRYTDHKDGNKEMLDNLFVKKRPLNGWSTRKIIENATTFDEAVSALSTVPFVATEYVIVSGVKKGTILARDPDETAYAEVLGQHNYDCRDDYIIITNFDFFFHDIREWFDPTGGKGWEGHPRRVVAQGLLNATTTLTPQVLFDTIDHPHVIATDTIFQAIMSVEKGLFNVSLPPLPSVSSPPPPCFAVCDTDADCDPACGHCTHYGDKSYWLRSVMSL